ncbi:MAG: hypothetical protein HY782_28645 [Chloroflexi bacterium]|nr:hypothetical protein [Chloroflexota bacterium]
MAHCRPSDESDGSRGENRVNPIYRVSSFFSRRVFNRRRPLIQNRTSPFARGVLSLTLLFAINATVFAFLPTSSEAACASNDAKTGAAIRDSSVISYTVFLPIVGKYPQSQPIAGESYNTVAVISDPTDRPAEIHPDLNLAVRGYVPTSAELQLIQYDHPFDSQAPQLTGLFADNRLGVVTSAFQVYDWDWPADRRGLPIADPPVTLAGLAATPEELVRVPSSGYDVGWLPTGYEVMVLYASAHSITLKYTRDDNVKTGYTLHLENICVEPTLLNLYRTMNNAGRSRLPSLFSGQPVGRAMSNEIMVAIRDTGAFLDPRWRNDWWQRQ